MSCIAFALAIAGAAASSGSSHASPNVLPNLFRMGICSLPILASLGSARACLAFDVAGVLAQVHPNLIMNERRARQWHRSSRWCRGQAAVGGTLPPGWRSDQSHRTRRHRVINTALLTLHRTSTQNQLGRSRMTPRIGFLAVWSTPARRRPRRSRIQ